MNSLRWSSRLSVLLAFLVSLSLHAIVLGLVLELREMYETRVTRNLPAPPNDDDEELTTPEDERRKITPGIDEGTAATATWIGFEEYEEHLAVLAEVEQAALTSAEARGAPSSGIAPLQAEQAEEPVQIVQAEEAEAGDTDTDSGAAADGEADVADQEREDPGPDLQLDLPPVDDADVSDADADEETEADADGETDRESGADSGADVVAVADEPESAKPAAVAAARPRGEPVEQGATPAEADSAATSTKKIPEVDWHSGKPLAVEGTEIRPYPLYRHIVIDSGDSLFAVRWTGLVRHNPIVTLQFDRTGRRPHINVLRKSGYKPFDDHYLISWLSRWTAKGEKLSKLNKGELSEPIVFKLLFIKEPEPKPEESKTEGAAKAKDK